MDVFVTKLAPDGTLIWSTFVGGPSYDRAYGVEVDANGDIYIAGRAGAGFPTTPGALQATFGGDNAVNGLYGPQDGFIAKLSSDGTTLLWSTYFGGGDRDFIRDLDIDATGVYVAVGELTGAHPHVTSGAYDTVRASGYDNVVAKVALTGDAVLWGTYFGGAGDESVPSVRRGPGGTVYLVASTDSTDLPTTAGSYQSNKASGLDFFVAKLAADGASLVYCTYFGGNASEDHETHHAFVTATGEVVLGFYTTSTNLPTTAGAIQASRAGPADGYVVRIAAGGDSLVAATYLGGNGGEDVQGIAVDAGGRVYVGGSTDSTNLPTTAGSLRSTAIGGGDTYVARLSPTLTTIEYMSYLGGNGDDQQRSLWIDGQGGLVTVGQSASPTLVVGPNALQPTNAGGTYDVLVGVFRIALP